MLTAQCTVPRRDGSAKLTRIFPAYERCDGGGLGSLCAGHALTVTVLWMNFLAAVSAHRTKAKHW